MNRKFSMKSSKRGMRTLSLVQKQDSMSSDSPGQSPENGLEMLQETNSQVAISMTALSVPMGLNYGWKPEYARMQNSFDPYESWLLYQAKSYLGHEVDLAGAKALFERIDITTRKPRETPTAPRPVGLLAALRALVAGGMIICMASGCVRVPESGPEQNTQSIITTANMGGVEKFYDREEGIVCYIVDGYQEVAMSCMVAKPGDGQ